VTLPGGGSCDGAVGGSFGGGVLLPNVARGVTAADCKTKSTVAGSRSGGGSGGDDVTLVNDRLKLRKNQRFEIAMTV
jgi:hypothetical protein